MDVRENIQDTKYILKKHQWKKEKQEPSFIQYYNLVEGQHYSKQLNVSSGIERGSSENIEVIVFLRMM